MKKKLFNRSQNGFTLLELIIALAIGVIVLAILGGALYQILAGSSSSTNNMMAIRQVQNVGYWFSMDVQQSTPEYITVGDNSETPDIGEVCTVVWDVISFDGTLVKDGHKAVYRLDGGSLYRDYYTTETMPYETLLDDYIFSYEKTALIAQFIDGMEITNGSTVILNVSATVEGWKTGTAERVYEIETRVDMVESAGG